MKFLILCLMTVGYTLAAPGIQKRDIDVFTLHQLPAVGVESTTHYCPEEDIPAKFIPSPPEIKSFPLPSLPVVNYGPPVIVPLKHEYPAPARQVYHPSPIVPHDEYGPPFPEYGLPPLRQVAPTIPTRPPTTTITVPHREYGVPNHEEGQGDARRGGGRQATPTEPTITSTELVTDPPTTTSTLPPTEPPQTTSTVPPTEPPTPSTVPPTHPPSTIITVPPTHPTKKIVHKPLFHKLHQIKNHFKKAHPPVVHYVKPTIVLYKKKIEFPFLKKLFHH